MHDCDEDGLDQDWHILPRRWSWLGLVVELSKPPLGVLRAVSIVAQGFCSMGEYVHEDLVAHYNWTLQQNEFRDAVVRDLESL